MDLIKLYIAKVKFNDKVNIVQTVTLHKVILSTLGELTQFKEGLSTLGVLDALNEHPDLLLPYYCCSYDDKLTPGLLLVLYCNYLQTFLIADTVRKVFTDIKFSDRGTNDRELEERAFMYFVYYPDDCEKST